MSESKCIFKIEKKIHAETFSIYTDTLKTHSVESKRIKTNKSAKKIVYGLPTVVGKSTYFVFYSSIILSNFIRMKKKGKKFHICNSNMQNM